MLKINTCSLAADAESSVGSVRGSGGDGWLTSGTVRGRGGGGWLTTGSVRGRDGGGWLTSGSAKAFAVSCVGRTMSWRLSALVTPRRGVCAEIIT